MSKYVNFELNLSSFCVLIVLHIMLDFVEQILKAVE